MLHRVRVANRYRVRILPDVSTGAPPAKQIPALVELHLEPFELGALLVAERLAASMPTTQCVLTLDQFVDVANHVDVVHCTYLRVGQAVTIPAATPSASAACSLNRSPHPFGGCGNVDMAYTEMGERIADRALHGRCRADRP